MNPTLQNSGRHHCSVWIITLSQMSMSVLPLASFHTKGEQMRCTTILLPNPQLSPWKFMATTRGRKSQRFPESISFNRQLLRGWALQIVDMHWRSLGSVTSCSSIRGNCVIVWAMWLKFCDSPKIPYLTFSRELSLKIAAMRNVQSIDISSKTP